MQLSFYVDRFTKRAHFLAIRGTTTAVEVAGEFRDQMLPLHEPSDSIQSDRDLRRTSNTG